MDELSPHAAQLRAAMAGPEQDAEGSGGTAAACARLAPSELGALLPDAYRTLADDQAPDHARRVAREVTWSRVQPSFTAAALTDLYAALAVSARPTDVQYAAAGLLRCSEPWDERALAGHAAVLVAAARQRADRTADAALAVAALAGPDTERSLAALLRTVFADSPLRRAEIEVALATGPRERALLAEDQRYGPALGAWPPLTALAELRAADALHVELAHRVLHTAADQLAALHAGETPYAADKAFTPADADTLGRAARLALRRDEPWAGELLTAVLPRLAVAPTSARTLPSQSACIVLAQAVEEWPTPESIAALREACRVVRHAGVTKKLDRLLRRAERNLVRRPECALRLPDLGLGPDGTRRLPCGAYTAVLTVTDEAALTWERADGTALKSVPSAARRDHPDHVAAARDLLGEARTRLRTLIRSLEGGCAEGTVHRYDRWRDDLAAHPLARGTARRLIWEVERAPGDWQAFLPAAETPGGHPAATAPVSPPFPVPDPAAAVRLWHPARATSAERRHWRDRIAELRLRQPFRQAYREHYPPSGTIGHTTDLFHGHVVRLEAVLGLAVRQGWHIDDGELALPMGGMTARFDLAGHLYPGATGWAEAGSVTLRRADGSPQPMADVDAVRLSELLRSVDLLVSAGSFAWCDRHAHAPEDRQRMNRLYDQPLGRTARLRRAALRRILADQITAGRIELGDRQLRLDGYAVHLATGRVTRDGDPVAIDLPTGRRAAPLPFLPYDEELLERVVRTVGHLMAA
ncbi:DUF4132 domain-containing protein [Streptomyces sp. NPDC056411]|uniref:DUF4132 domain-containing protein n=1 Tax=Streptomyces sp. NPDC056411 TaxID=3345813 RepID=UPI0035E1B684